MAVSDMVDAAPAHNDAEASRDQPKAPPAPSAKRTPMAPPAVKQLAASNSSNAGDQDACFARTKYADV